MTEEDMKKCWDHIIKHPNAEFSLFGKMAKHIVNLEAELKQLQNTPSNNKYTAPQASPKSCTGCKYEPEKDCTAECCRHKYADMYKRA